eukprot:scaffold118461_cov27-Attheya_sp.AAC.1
MFQGEPESSPERVEISCAAESSPAQCLQVNRRADAVMQMGADTSVSVETSPTPPQQGKAVEGMSTVASVGSSAELDAIQREARERLATKADDADVPTYFNGWLVPEDLPAFQIAGCLLKVVMLCWWKRHVFRSFFEWLGTKHTSLRSYDKDAGSGVSWNGRKYQWTETGRADWR